MSIRKDYNTSPDFLSLLLESSTEGIIACDNKFNITFRNQRAVDIHGHPPEVDANEWPKYITVMNADGVTPTKYDDLPILRALRGQTVKDAYHVLIRKNKPSIFVKCNAHPLQDPEGNQIGAFLSVEDSEDLAESIARFRAIFEQSPLSIQIVNKSGKTILVNKAFQKLWGFNDDFLHNFIFKEYSILNDPILKESGEQENVKRAFEGDIVHLKEFLYDPIPFGFDARPRWTLGILYPLKDSNGEVREVVVIHQDTTDQHENVEEKEKLYSQLEAIVRQMPAGLMVSDPKGDISLYNKQMKRLIGDPSQAKNAFSYPIMKALSGEITSSEVNVELLTGEKMTFASNSGPILDQEGKVKSSVLIATDITKEKRAESNRNFLTHVKSLLISTLDYDKIIDKIASAAIPYMADGCMVDLLEGDKLNRIVTRHRDPSIQLYMDELQKHFPPVPSARVIQSGKPELMKHVDLEVIRKNTVNSEHMRLVEKIGPKSHITVPLQIRGQNIGAINLIVCGTRLPFDEEDLYLAIEIGRHASLAIDNAKLYSEARTAVQLRDDFISIASHELRTPITSLNLQLEVLTNIVEDIPETANTKLMQKFFGNTKNQLKRLTRLVDDMLDISRINSGKLKLNFRVVNTTKVVQEVLERFREQFKFQGISCSLESPPEVLLNCDAERVDQVVTNFITNAIRYGGKKPIEVFIEQDDIFVRIKVRDHGRGIARSDQERIFLRFERAHTDQDVDGLGLGLYINRQIVEGHKGKIWVESEPGEGSTFIVQFPKLRL